MLFQFACVCMRSSMRERQINESHVTIPVRCLAVESRPAMRALESPLTLRAAHVYPRKMGKTSTMTVNNSSSSCPNT